MHILIDVLAGLGLAVLALIVWAVVKTARDRRAAGTERRAGQVAERVVAAKQQPVVSTPVTARTAADILDELVLSHETTLRLQRESAMGDPQLMALIDSSGDLEVLDALRQGSDLLRAQQVGVEGGALG